MKGSNLAFFVVGLLAGVSAIWFIGQQRAEIADLKRQLAQAQTTLAPAPVPAPAAAAPPPAREVPAVGPPRTITDDQRATIVGLLSSGGWNAGSPVWFSTTPNNAEATAFQQMLQSVFEEAGWVVKGSTTTAFPVKGGVFVFAADANPPQYVNAITEALEAGGVTITSTGIGYRDYYNERKAADPNWRGFEMAADQTAVIAIGRAPTP